MVEAMLRHLSRSKRQRVEQSWCASSACLTAANSMPESIFAALGQYIDFEQLT
jgi:hypothetical protein